MKKTLVLLLLFICPALTAFGGATPLRLGILGTHLQLPPAYYTDVIGLRLNLPMSDNQNVMGLDLGIVGKASTVNAIQVNLFNLVTREFNGIEVGIINKVGNKTGSMMGLQVGAFNMVDGDVSGIQIGLFNIANDVHGLQIGVFNKTVSMRGIQIGVINLIEDGPLEFFPLINAAF